MRYEFRTVSHDDPQGVIDQITARARELEAQMRADGLLDEDESLYDDEEKE